MKNKILLLISLMLISVLSFSQQRYIATPVANAYGIKMDSMQLGLGSWIKELPSGGSSLVGGGLVRINDTIKLGESSLDPAGINWYGAHENWNDYFNLVLGSESSRESYLDFYLSRSNSYSASPTYNDNGLNMYLGRTGIFTQLLSPGYDYYGTIGINSIDNKHKYPYLEYRDLTRRYLVVADSLGLRYEYPNGSPLDTTELVDDSFITKKYLLDRLGGGGSSNLGPIYEVGIYGLSTTGFRAGSSDYSIFLGGNAGNSATSAAMSNFLGGLAGSGATNASHSNFFGYQAGMNADQASYSNLLGFQVGGSFTNNNIGSNNIIIGSNISLPNLASNSLNIGNLLYGTGLNSVFTGDPIITPVTGGKIGIGKIPTTYSLEIAGDLDITGTYRVNGVPLSTGGSSIIVSPASYSLSTPSWNANSLYTNSITLGSFAGSSTNTYNSVIIGSSTGSESVTASGSVLLGGGAGYLSTNLNNSVIIGSNAGYRSGESYGSIYIGNGAGNYSKYSNTSILIGYFAGSAFLNDTIGRNNIILGSNISLPNEATNSLNIGGVLFGTNIYSDYTLTSSPSIGGKIGIGVNAPRTELEVNGVISVSSLNTAPTSATDTGVVGEIRYTADYIYVCVATNTWKRSALTTW